MARVLLLQHRLCYTSLLMHSTRVGRNWGAVSSVHAWCVQWMEGEGDDVTHVNFWT